MLSLKILTTIICILKLVSIIRSENCNECIINDEIINEIDASNIRDHLRYLSSMPHPAGSEQNSDVLARYIKQQWENQGLKVKYDNYDVRLSLPNLNDSNKVRIIDQQDQVIFEATLEEPFSDPTPGYSAHSGLGTVKGDVVYVNYGSQDDFQWLKNAGIQTNGSILIAKYGKTYRGLIALNAQRSGAAGLLLYPDPKDYAANGTDNVYPTSKWLPGTGIEKGTLRTDYGDQSTPNYPSVEGAYRISDIDGLKIVVQTISYNDAQQILKNIAGLDCPADWIGSLHVSYKVGPGFIDPNQKLEVKVNNQFEIKKITNVIGAIHGCVEPDRFVIVASHRDSWAFGAVNPGSAAAVSLEISRVLTQKAITNGCCFRRTIIFLSTDAETQGYIGATEYLEKYRTNFVAGTVIYLGTEVAASGCGVAAINGFPITARMLFDIAKKVSNPIYEERSQGLHTVYDQWLNKFVPSQSSYPLSNSEEPLPITTIARTSDLIPWVQYGGVTAVDNAFASVEVSGSRINRYPTYHTLYDTYYGFENFIDPGYNCSKAIAQLTLLEILATAHSDILPFNHTDYASFMAYSFQQIMLNSGNMLQSNNISIDYLDKAIQKFKKASITFHKLLETIDRNNSLKVRIANDKMMLVDRALLKCMDKGQPNTRHVVFGSETHLGFWELVSVLRTATSPEDRQKVLKIISETASHVNEAASVLEWYSETCP